MSDSDDSSLRMDSILAKKKGDKKHHQDIVVPKVSYTGSRRQPMSIDANNSDDDDSSASSMLEVLPPKKKAPSLPSFKGAAVKKPAAGTKKVNTTTFSVDTSDDSDSDDSLLNNTYGFTKPLAKSTKTSTTNSITSTATSASMRETLTNKTTNSTQDKQVANKQLEKERKKQEQERKKQKKLAEKSAEQARKKAEREALKERKEREKEEAKQNKKRQREAQQQASGKFFKEEIVLMVDPPLYRRREEHGCYDWREHDEMTKHNFLVKEYPSAIGGENCHALQWIRRDYSQGGASQAWEELRKNNIHGFNHMDRLAVVIDDPKIFLKLLQRTPQDDADDDYPQLRQWLLRLEHGWKAAWPHSTTNRSKVLLILHRPLQELDRQWVEFRRTNKNSQRREASSPPPTEKEFHDATTWMLIQFHVELQICGSYEEIWTTALKMTRALAKSPYVHPMSELECIKRIKPMTADNASKHDKAKDAWLRFLQQIPGISETMARNLILHYPNIQSLWQGLAEAGDDAPELVAGCLSTKVYKRKLSQSIHRIFTSQNPEELI